MKNYPNRKWGTLKYCLECKKTWEIGTDGGILFYTHLPTYGLERKTCKGCNNLSTESYEKQKTGSNHE